MPKIKLLIADNQFLTREGLKAIFAKNADFMIVGEAVNEKELASKVKELKPDVVTLDFYAPGFFKLETIAKLWRQYPKTKLLIITSNKEKEDILETINLGVGCYILKECDETEIFNAVYAAKKGEKFFCGRVLDKILEKQIPNYLPDDRTTCEPVLLSHRETEITRLIAHGYTTKSIAKELFLSFHTVSTHRKNIFKKLKVKSASELVAYAMRKGILNS